MNCQNCHKGSISFARVWLMGESGTHQCSKCGATFRFKLSRLTLSIALRVLSWCLAALAVVLGFRFLSWFVFAAIFVASLAVNAFVVLRFGRLEPDAARPPART